MKIKEEKEKEKGVSKRIEGMTRIEIDVTGIEKETRTKIKEEIMREGIIGIEIEAEIERRTIEKEKRRKEAADLKIGIEEDLDLEVVLRKIDWFLIKGLIKRSKCWRKLLRKLVIYF
jgi:glycerol-3-phosphate O-acyltransferase